MRRSRLTAGIAAGAGLLIAVGVASFAGSSSSNEKAKSTTTTATAPEDPHLVSHGGQVDPQTGKVVPGSAAAVSKAGSTKTASGQKPNPSADEAAANLPHNYVHAGPAVAASTNPGCDLKRGVLCRVEFRGQYRLSDYPSGKIRMQAFEDDLDKPWQADLPVKLGGSQFFLKLPVQPGPKATKMKFTTQLLDPTDKVIWQGETYEYPVAAS